MDALDSKSAILGAIITVAKQEGDGSALLSKVNGSIGDTYNRDTGDWKLKTRKNAPQLAFMES